MEEDFTQLKMSNVYPKYIKLSTWIVNGCLNKSTSSKQGRLYCSVLQAKWLLTLFVLLHCNSQHWFNYTATTVLQVNRLSKVMTQCAHQRDYGTMVCGLLYSHSITISLQTAKSDSTIVFFHGNAYHILREINSDKPNIFFQLSQITNEIISIHPPLYFVTFFPSPVHHIQN